MSGLRDTWLKRSLGPGENAVNTEVKPLMWKLCLVYNPLGHVGEVHILFLPSSFEDLVFLIMKVLLNTHTHIPPSHASLSLWPAGAQMMPRVWPDRLTSGALPHTGGRNALCCRCFPLLFFEIQFL